MVNVWERRKIPAEIWLLLIFLATTVFITPRLYSGDEIQYFAYLRSVWKDGDLQFRNEYEWLYHQAPKKQSNFQKAFLSKPNITGYTRNDAPIGCAILWAPFFALGDLYAKLSPDYPEDGFSPPYIFMICYASALYGFLGFFFQYKIARRFFPSAKSLAAVLTLWFGAHAIYYIYITPPMSHATSIFTTSLFVYLWLRFRDQNNVAPFLFLGLVGGLTAMVRWQDALFLILPLLDSRILMRQKLSFATLAFFTFLPQLWVWYVLNGELNPYSTGNLKGKFFWYGRYFLPVLFSSYHGLFVWTPVTALCIAGFYYLIQRDRIFWLLIVVFLLQFYSIISLDTWQGGAGFGLRYIISCTVIFTLGLTALYSRLSIKAIIPLSAFFIVWNIFMVIQVSVGMIPRDGHFPILRMIRNQFVEVPGQLADITYRYLFDRSSFYQKDQKEKKVESRE